MDAANNNLSADGFLVIPPDFPVGVSCPSCGWRKEYRVFRLQWDTPEAVTVWLDIVIGGHGEASPACTVGDNLNVKVNVPKMKEEMQLKNSRPS